MGILIGQLPRDSLATRAISHDGLPLLLSPCEAYFIWKHKLARIVSPKAEKTEIDENFKRLSIPPRVVIETTSTRGEPIDYTDVDASHLWRCYFDDAENGKRRVLVQNVFEHFWSLGYFVQSSTNLHSDFVLYAADPLVIHAAYVVVCVFWKQKFKILDIMAYSRQAQSVKKSVVLASIRYQGEEASETTEEASNLQSELEKLSIAATQHGDHSNDSKAKESLGEFVLNFESLERPKKISLVELKWAGVS